MAEKPSEESQDESKPRYYMRTADTYKRTIEKIKKDPLNQFGLLIYAHIERAKMPVLTLQKLMDLPSTAVFYKLIYREYQQVDKVAHYLNRLAGIFALNPIELLALYWGIPENAAAVMYISYVYEQLPVDEKKKAIEQMQSLASAHDLDIPSLPDD